MPIQFHPRPGTLLYCDFSTGFRPPEIVKRRPVVVISKAHQELVSVVPISTTEPLRIEEWHHQLDAKSLPRWLNRWWVPHWAKCDIIMTVAFWRLERAKAGKHPTTGKRIYLTHIVCTEDLAAIRLAVSKVLGIFRD
jgi:uncharacterized protein YifN (PemK superfamily)